MKPPPFAYAAPTTVEEAVAALADAGRGAKVLAGGQSLIPLLNMRLIAPTTLVDINRVAGLDEVHVGPAGVRVGALVRQRDLEDHADAMAAHPLLAQALPHIAHPVIRNRGTVVGSIVHADPAAELPAVLALTGGDVTLESASGRRTVPAEAFFVGPLEAAINPGELVTSVRFGPIPEGAGTAVVELSRRHGDYAMCGIVAQVVRDEDGGLRHARVATIGVHPTPLVVDVTEALASGEAEAGALVADLIDPDADLHASVAYRRHLTRVLTGRAVQQAVTRSATTSAPPAGGPVR